MGWFSEPTSADDFVTYFLRPMLDLEKMRGRQELVRLFTRGYGLSPESVRDCKTITKRLIRSIEKRDALCFVATQVQAAKKRFEESAATRITPSQMVHVESWFLDLERIYCSPANETANLVIDQWKQACQKEQGTPAKESAEAAQATDMQSDESNQEALVTPKNSDALSVQASKHGETTTAEKSLAMPAATVDQPCELSKKEELPEILACNSTEETERVQSLELDTPKTQVDALLSTPKIAIIEATCMDDAAWAEVKQECINSKGSWTNPSAVEKTLASFESLLKGASLPGMLFDECRQSDAQQKVFAVDASSVEREIWFLGDIHSDLLALESALAFLKRRVKPVAIVLLGDLFDDGPLGAETVLRVLRLILDDPSAVALIAGNHDEALEISADGGEFRSGVSPCEYSEWLNAPSQQNNELARRLGEITIKLVERSPRALFFRDGLLAAHGGVPLSDVWNSLLTKDDLNSAACLQDFVWTRPHHRRKRTVPNRSRKGAGLGHQDFDGFCELAEKLFGFPVRWMLRGHDHVDSVERFASFDAYQNHPLLTINTLCYRLYRENLGAYVHAPCIAKHVPGDLPEIHCLRIPDQLVRQFYPEPIVDN